MSIKLSSNNVLNYIENFDWFYRQDLVSSITIESHNTFLIKLQSAIKIIIKQERYYCDEDLHKNQSFFNEFRLYKALSNTLNLPIKNLYFDSQNSIISYQYPNNYTDLKTESKNFKKILLFIPELIGCTLAKLHCRSSISQTCHQVMNETSNGKLRYRFPYHIHLQHKIEPETFFTIPPDSYKFIQFFQSDQILITSLQTVIYKIKNYCLTHNNLSFNNILIPESYDNYQAKNQVKNPDLIKFINWENCCWGDPAFDLGSIISGYLLLWLTSLIVHPEIKLETSLQLALTPLEQIQPSIVALTKAYLNTWNDILDHDPEFLTRVVQFSGLALIYHIIEMINSFKGFNNHSICILIVAKNLLRQPEKYFNSVFGLTQTELLSN
ncbi:phosphotransferase family protein [Moorena producens]|uniref:phosphotransferase family protein n=1 Tax=Moorena producens TaxID=1155739 RepID=UPI003C75B69A